ncbi:MAG: hemerythrin domain-containing protein [Acidimicrobiales bacterium]
MPSAVDLLSGDHRRVEELYEQHEAQPSRALAARIGDELVLHSMLEETVLYPTVREQLADGPSLADRAEAEHASIKALVAELEGSADAAVPEILAELMALVRRHVEEEERVLLPALAERLDAERDEVMGRVLAQLRAENEARLRT